MLITCAANFTLNYESEKVMCEQWYLQEKMCVKEMAFLVHTSKFNKAINQCVPIKL